MSGSKLTWMSKLSLDSNVVYPKVKRTKRILAYQICSNSCVALKNRPPALECACNREYKNRKTFLKMSFSEYQGNEKIELISHGTNLFQDFTAETLTANIFNIETCSSYLIYNDSNT